MTEQLKPCPFCGSEANVCVNKHESLWSHEVVDWTAVRCTNDDCGIGVEPTCEGYEPSAVEAWNRRAQPAQAGAEPVAWMYTDRFGEKQSFTTEPPPSFKASCQALYTHPPSRVPLTDSELRNISKQQDPVVPLHHNVLAFAHAIIAAYEAKNGIGGGK